MSIKSALQRAFSSAVNSDTFKAGAVVFGGWATGAATFAVLGAAAALATGSPGIFNTAAGMGLFPVPSALIGMGINWFVSDIAGDVRYYLEQNRSPSNSRFSGIDHTPPPPA